ncbi:potassium channel family protein [Spongiimicrobium salis]|uniref:potassium channel family protein n=1 Tax=Spongiimicrobium salis TaxID=1667022 RepID=UPI00374D1911
MLKRLYKHRFEFFLLTQVFILFSSLLVPQKFHEHILLPLLFLLNICAGILLISKRRKLMWFLICLFLISAGVFGSSLITRTGNGEVLLRMSIYFIFYSIVTWNIIHQVWSAKIVDKNVIMGLMSGYISLGFLAFLLFMSIELIAPASFQGPLLDQDNFDLRADGIMYYAYITLLTIGYGEIVPTTPVAQKAAILVGLMGQFYMVIITAVVVEKYIRHSTKES